jgi:dipeptidyl aminopeptidase/acylaminoacyl peptidase
MRTQQYNFRITSNRLAYTGLVIGLLFVAVLLGGCRELLSNPAPGQVLLGNQGQGGGMELERALASPSSTITTSITEPATQTPFLTPTVLPSATATATLAPSPTPDPYAAYRMQTLISRSYGGGEVRIEETLQVTSFFTRTLISYPSDGLRIYGFMNVPKQGQPPYPVIIANHGYINPLLYETLDYTTRYADAFARAGFLVLHPNLRGYPPSEGGENLFRVGMAVDVLNLIALVTQTGGQPGALEQANPQAIGLWGHSMGGGISTRVVTIDRNLRAVVLYGAMSADERLNFEAISRWSQGQRGVEELMVSEEELRTISPIYYLDRVQAAVSIHHGGSDELVPVGWSHDLCQRLQDLAKQVECFIYPGQPHTFHGDQDLEFIQRSIEFFNRELHAP